MLSSSVLSAVAAAPEGAPAQGAPTPPGHAPDLSPDEYVELPPPSMLPLVTAEFAAAAIMIPNLIEMRKGTNEAAAIGGLTTIADAQGLYREGDKDGNGVLDYATSLDQLAAAGLIDEQLGSGHKQGYVYTILVPEPPNDTKYNWSAGATPAVIARTGDRAFFVDETGVIRGNSTCKASNGTLVELSIGTSPSCMDNEVRALSIGSLSALDILSDGQAVLMAQGLLAQMGDNVTDAILIGLDTDGDGALSFQNLLEDPAVLDARFANMMGGASPALPPGPSRPSPFIGSFFDVFTDYSRDMGALLELGAANEVVDFTVPLTRVQPGAAAAAAALLADVPPLDHFKCYGASGDSVDALLALQDQFDAMSNSLDTVKAFEPKIFCNPTRKSVVNGTGASIRNADGHLAGYHVEPVFASSPVGRTVVVSNQFGKSQVLTTTDVQILFVPSQKAAVDGRAVTAGGGVPEGLDHFKCYGLSNERSIRKTVTLVDQFDVADQTSSKVDVGPAVFLCNPTVKHHPGTADDLDSPILNPGGHLVCYEIRAAFVPHVLTVNNQLGDEQSITTKAVELLCVPSVKRVPRPNIDVIDAFHLLEAQIARLPDTLMSNGERDSFVGKLEQAEAQYMEGHVCLADNLMEAYLNHAQASRNHATAPGQEGDPLEGNALPDENSNGNGNGQEHDGGGDDGNGNDDAGAAAADGPVVQSHQRGVDAAAVAEDMFNRGLDIRNGMFHSFFDVFFDVFVAPSQCFVAGIGTAPTLHVMQSDNTMFSAMVAFPPPHLQTIEAGGETWTQVSIETIEARSGAPGLPGIPYWRGLIGIPSGATADLMVDRTASGMAVGKRQHAMFMNLYPFQGDAADQDLVERSSHNDTFSDGPFVVDPKAYAVDAFWPPDPCKLTPVGQYRDLQMVQIVCAAGQYNPVTDELRLFDSLSFDVAFSGGTGKFLSSQSMSPFESAPSLYRDAVLNHDVLGKYVADVDISGLICWGEELLILTHPDFVAAAALLQAWKLEKGITTHVINVGPGTAFETGAEIDDMIEDRYDNCVVRPSYILLLGDSEFIPPAATDYDSTIPDCSSCGDITTGSDWGYATYVQILFDAFFPDFGVARIPADTEAEALASVNKSIAYESDPPFVNFGTGGPFYTTAGFASQFQCCRMNLDGTPLGGVAGTDQRGFIETSELARDTLLAAGKSVERIYTETVDDGGCTGASCPPSPVQSPYSGSTTPNRYWGGALLPVTLRAGSGFPWDGSTADIVSAINEGRFLMLHRDHGNSGGWSNPGFDTGDLGSLTNGELLPVVYSVNCASGYWDRETDTGGTSESFMEQILLKTTGGAVGGLGDNRNSPTWANNALTRGFFDATWPTTVGDFGGGATHRRLGDVLNWGKVYALTQAGVVQTSGDVTLDDAIAEYFMWHAFGDPTLEMWTSNPWRLTLSDKLQFELKGYDVSLDYPTNGAEITAFFDTDNGVEPYGRAVVINGTAVIQAYKPHPEPPAPEELSFSASFPNAVSVMLVAPSTGPQSLAVPPEEGTAGMPSPLETAASEMPFTTAPVEMVESPSAPAAAVDAREVALPGEAPPGAPLSGASMDAASEVVTGALPEQAAADLGPDQAPGAPASPGAGTNSPGPQGGAAPRTSFLGSGLGSSAPGAVNAAAGLTAVALAAVAVVVSDQLLRKALERRRRGRR